MTSPDGRSEPLPPRRHWALLLIAVCLVAANLRGTISGVGPLLEQIAADEGVSHAALGALGALPLLTWAIVSPLAHGLSTRIGLSNTVTWSLVVLALGTAWRSVPGSPLNLWLGTVLLGAGIAVGNVLLPAAIKRDFPGRIPLVMGVYTALLGLMASIASGVVVPISEVPSGDGALGWRVALLATGALILPALAVWPWAMSDRGRAVPDGSPSSAAGRGGAGRRIWRDPIAWLVATYMGTQSAVFYTLSTWLPPYETSLGRTPVAAGFDLMIFQVAGIAGSMLLPLFAHGRLRRWLPPAIPALGLVAWLGMLLAPGLLLVWIALGGFICGASITMSLTLIAIRSRTQDHASALSGMAQSLGYAIAAVGPVAFGWLHGVTGGWWLPFLLVWVAAAAQLVIGIAVGRPRFVLEPRGPGTTRTTG